MNLILVICLMLATTGVVGGHFIEAPPDATPSARVAVGAGEFDTFHNDEQNRATDLRLEYRARSSFYEHGITRVHPFIGAEYTSDGSAYGLMGVAADVRYQSLAMTPSVGAGAYAKGDGRDLGAVIEIRSQFELAYEFNGGNRIAAALSHLSNANLGSTNPGVEVWTLYYQHALDW